MCEYMCACEIDLPKRASAAIAFGFSQVRATGINTAIHVCVTTIVLVQVLLSSCDLC